MDNITDKYAALLARMEQREKLAAEYLELTKKQEAAIAGDDDETLLAAIDERERLAAELDIMSAETAEPIRELYKSKLNMSVIDEILERTRVILTECLELDRKNMKDIKAQMNKATNDSRDLKKRREGINRYAQTDYIFTPSVLDEHQ